jgi:hypothetical protein
MGLGDLIVDSFDADGKPGGEDADRDLVINHKHEFS